MITKNDLPSVLTALNYTEDNSIWTKKFNENTSSEFSISVDFDNEKFIYPKDVEIHRETTTNFSDNENFVVFEIVNRLFEIGYLPKNIELEKKVQIGRGQEKVTAWGDVLVKDNSGVYYAIIEAKTYGKEFNGAWKKTLTDSENQLFSYVDQLRMNKNIPYGILYASDFQNDKITRKYHILNFKDNEEYLKEQKNARKLYINSSNSKELYNVWKETYEQDFTTVGMFESKSKPFGLL